MSMRSHSLSQQVIPERLSAHNLHPLPYQRLRGCGFTWRCLPQRHSHTRKGRLLTAAVRSFTAVSAGLADLEQAQRSGSQVHHGLQHCSRRKYAAPVSLMVLAFTQPTPTFVLPFCSSASRSGERATPSFDSCTRR